MKRLKQIILTCLAGATFFVSASANAFYCSEPSPPGRYSKPTQPTPPSVPYCVNEYSNTHTCDDWQIDSYNREIENYNWQLKMYSSEVDAYIRKLESYVDDAIEYANCEIKSLD
jgi:hypothetical protein